MGELRVWSISKFLEEFEQLRKQVKFYNASTIDLEILEQMVELIGENLGECPLFMLLTGVETVRLENGQLHGWTDNLRQVLQDMNINDGKSWLKNLSRIYFKREGKSLNLTDGVIKKIMSNIAQGQTLWSKEINPYAINNLEKHERFLRKQSADWQEPVEEDVEIIPAEMTAEEMENEVDKLDIYEQHDTYRTMSKEIEVNPLIGIIVDEVEEIKNLAVYEDPWIEKIILFKVIQEAQKTLGHAEDSQWCRSTWDKLLKLQVTTRRQLVKNILNINIVLRRQGEALIEQQALEVLMIEVLETVYKHMLPSMLSVMVCTAVHLKQKNPAKWATDMVTSLESQQIRNTEKLLITIYDSYRKASAPESGETEIDTKSLRGICKIISEVIRFRKEHRMIPVDGSNGYFYEDINQRHGGYFPVGYHPGGKYISSYGHLNAPELPNYHRIAKYAQIDPELLDFFNLKDRKPQKTQEPHQAHIMDASSEDGKMDDEILEDEREEVHLMDDIPV
jgi:hypothetical protein